MNGSVRFREATSSRLIAPFIRTCRYSAGEDFKSSALTPQARCEVIVFLHCAAEIRGWKQSDVPPCRATASKERNEGFPPRSYKIPISAKFIAFAQPVHCLAT